MPPPHSSRSGLSELFKPILMGLGMTLLLISCHQDELKNPADTSNDPKFDTYYKLRTFYEKTEGLPQTKPALLPRTTYSVQDVVTYVEGTLNLVYADPSITWASYERSVDTFSIPLTSGYADEEDVEDLFERARDTASVFFYGISGSDKFPFLFDVVILVSSSASQLDISVDTRIGKDHRNLTPFGESDYWDIFEDGNTCDPEDNYTDAPYASTVMSDALNLYFQPYGCYFFTDILTASSQDQELDPQLTAYGWRQDNPGETAGDWIIDFRTLYTMCNHTTSECLQFVNNGIYCLAPDEMNYYFGSIVSIYNAYANAVGLDFMHSDIGIYSHQNETYDYNSWECNDSYGTLGYCAEGSYFPFFLPQCC